MHSYDSHLRFYIIGVYTRGALFGRSDIEPFEHMVYARRGFIYTASHWWWRDGIDELVQRQKKKQKTKMLGE